MSTLHVWGRLLNLADSGTWSVLYIQWFSSSLYTWWSPWWAKRCIWFDSICWHAWSSEEIILLSTPACLITFITVLECLLLLSSQAVAFAPHFSKLKSPSYVTGSDEVSSPSIVLVRSVHWFKHVKSKVFLFHSQYFPVVCSWFCMRKERECWSSERTPDFMVEREGYPP